MNWKLIILDLKNAGFTQGEIAEYAGISQPSVSDLAHGRTKSPTWVVGDALLRMRRRAKRKTRRAAEHTEAA